MAVVAVRCGIFAAAMLLLVSAAVLPQTLPVSPSAPADSVTMRLIVVGSEDEAYRVVERLRRGEDFAELAKKVSLDPTADNGGLIGRRVISGLRPELRKALEGVAVGQLSTVVQIPTGFAVLKVVPDSEAAGASPLASPALAATGSVKTAVDLSGYNVSVIALRQITNKPADWEQDPQTICRIRAQSLAETQRGFEREISSGSYLGSTSDFDVAQAHVVLGQVHAYFGRMSETIELLRKAQNLVARRLPAARLELEELLGIAHLHKAQLENGIFSAPGHRCLLSVSPNHRLTRTADLKRAIDRFSRYLAERPGELEVRWLLNLAHMIAGTYPVEVPRAQLIPPSAFDSVEDVGRFVDVASQSGLASIASAGGVIVDDFDNDGRLDVVTSDVTGCEPMHFFRREEDGRFVERTSQAGLANQLGGLNVLQTDYNNDGYLDILLLRGGWEAPQRKSLLRNNRDGTFTDVTAASGLARPATSTQAAVWTDINQDGFLDLFIGNENSPAQLFLNKRDGTFEDIAYKAGVDRTAFSKGVAAADYDNDGWPDLYVSNMGPNFLYRNNRDGTFTEVGQAAGVSGSGYGFATWFFDYDNDGWDDIFSAIFITSVEETARTYLRLPNNGNTLRLYRNRGDGSFDDVTRQAGLDKVLMPMGSNFGDIDNDGFLDIYLGTGSPSYAALLPSVLLRNRDGKSFVDVTLSSGTGEFHKGHGVAFADLDNDGDEEIVFEVGGATPADRHPLRLFQNPGHGNDWLTLKLVGVKTNRAAIGARITVTVNNESGKRVIHRTVGNGSSFGASPLQQHIGLGRGARSVDIEVYWPITKTRQRFTGLEKNQFLEVTEFAQDYRQLHRPFLRLGGSDHDTSKR